MNHRIAIDEFTKFKEKLFRVRNSIFMYQNINLNGTQHLFDEADSLITNFYSGELAFEGISFKTSVNRASMASNEPSRIDSLEKVIENILKDIRLKEKLSHTKKSDEGSVVMKDLGDREKLLKQINSLEIDNKKLEKANVSLGSTLSETSHFLEQQKQNNSILEQELSLEKNKTLKSKQSFFLKVSIFTFLSYIIGTSYKLLNIPFNLGIYLAVQILLIIILVYALIKNFSEKTTFWLNFLIGLFLVILGVVLTKYL